MNYRYGVYKVFLLNGNRVSERQIRPAGQTEDQRGQALRSRRRTEARRSRRCGRLRRVAGRRPPFKSNTTSSIAGQVSGQLGRQRTFHETCRNLRQASRVHGDADRVSGDARDVFLPRAGGRSVSQSRSRDRQRRSATAGRHSRRGDHRRGAAARRCHLFGQRHRRDQRLLHRRLRATSPAHSCWSATSKAPRRIFAKKLRPPSIACRAKRFLRSSPSKIRNPIPS